VQQFDQLARDRSRAAVVLEQFVHEPRPYPEDPGPATPRNFVLVNKFTSHG
jgi:hypothetical protein